MDYSHNRFGVLWDLHLDVEVMFNRLSLAGVAGSLPGRDGQNASLSGSDRALANIFCYGTRYMICLRSFIVNLLGLLCWMKFWEILASFRFFK